MPNLELPPPCDRTFELLLSYDCNAKCGFCYNPPLTPEVLAQSVPFALAAQLLVQAREQGHDGVWLTGGEPTLRPDLPKILLLAKKLRFRRIQIGTNGVRLANAEHVGRLTRAGLNYARVSLHAASEDIHDELLELPGSFRKALRAVAHLKKSGVYVGLNFVVTSRNVGELPAFFELALGRLGIYDVDVIFLHHRGMMEKNSDALSLPYAHAVGPLREAWKIVKRHGLRRGMPSLINVPPCILPELTPWISDWSAHEGTDSLALPGKSGGDLIQMKGAQKQKGPRCATCDVASRCLGYELSYARRYGDGEFHPITAIAQKNLR